jgi:hypothetical protein
MFALSWATRCYDVADGAGHRLDASAGLISRRPSSRRTGVMVRLLIVIGLFWSAIAQAATDRDLFAAYCLGAVRAVIAAPLPYVGGLPPSAEAEAVEINRRIAARLREAEQHLSHYLLARDPGDSAILFALKSGEIDQKTMTERPVDNHCFSAPRCPKIDEPCITACRMEDPLYAKLSKCSDVGKLLSF